ncbi:MAG: hypothetical protein QOJ64_2317 [Acidobacteriota bacterium]|nr:hypothetical protein [Acidobacteriota bacterium]
MSLESGTHNDQEKLKENVTNMKVRYPKILEVAFFVVLLHCLGGGRLVVAQSATQTEQTGGQRGDVYSSEFTSTRPTGKSTNPRRYRYLIRTHPRPTSRSPKGTVYASIGVTIGRARAATDAEVKDTSIAKVSVCAERQENRCVRWQEMAVERISDSTPITNGTLIQMMIEYLAYKDAAGMNQDSNRLGYLYVINRVEFKDKTASPPRLIYPIKSNFGGHSLVLPGKTVMLPGPRLPWRVTRNKAAVQEFETYIIIISPVPLKDTNGLELQGDNLSDIPLALDEQLVRNWIKWWGGGEVRLDLENGVGQLFSQREQAAGGDPAQMTRDSALIDADLNQADPPPQIGFSKAINPGGTMLITIKLPFKDTTAAAQTGQ